MPPSPRSLLWPTMEIPKKLYFSVEEAEVNAGSLREPRAWALPTRQPQTPPRTHVECDGDDVE